MKKQCLFPPLFTGQTEEKAKEREKKHKESREFKKLNDLHVLI